MKKQYNEGLHKLGFDKKNPYSRRGIILIVVGVSQGGALGGGLGAGVGYLIISLGKKKLPHRKKVLFSLLITAGGVMAYLLLAVTIINLIN